MTKLPFFKATEFPAIRQMTEDNVEIGVCDANGFKRFTPEEVKDYLTNIA